MNQSGKVAVIIPFFQHTRGILTKTIRSVLDQTRVDGVQLIIVDDGSPVKAREELASLLSETGERLVIVEQANRGAAAARNTGLENVASDVEAIAFVDSDDIWTPDHLSNAMFTLNKGFDFYFSDFYQLGQSVTAFNRAGRINIADHPLVRGSEHIHEYRGDMINQVITGNIIGTPVVVFRRESFRGIRFRENFKHAGEDYLFWMDVALQNKKIAFSDLPECRCGSGVNIYAESAWGQAKYLSIIVDDVKYRKEILSRYRINEAQRKVIKSRIRELRRNFTAGVMHRMARGWLDYSVLCRYMWVDKYYPMVVLPTALRILWDGLLKRLSG
jgi:succinoglycan biosynthesis protein ExoW